MDQVQTTELRQDLVNQLRLDLLLRGLGTTVLRRKFREIYAKLNGGKEWINGPESGHKFCRSKLGIVPYVLAHAQTQEMMEGGNIQQWDLHCLQSVIAQMLTTTLEQMKEDNNSSTWNNNIGQANSLTWDRSWWGQLSDIRILASIRHSIAHMPTATLSQAELDEKWTEAVDALTGLGAKPKEIKEVLQMCPIAVSLPGPGQQEQAQVSLESKTKEKLCEAKKTIKELRTQIAELQIKGQRSKDEVQGELNNNNEYVNSDKSNKQRKLRADYLTKKGEMAGRSRDWKEALEFYTKALEIPDISNDQRRKIYINRSWIHLKILQMPEFESRLNLKPSGSRDSEKKRKSKIMGKVRSRNQSASKRGSQFVDEKFLEVDPQNWPGKLTEELKQFHLTAGMTDAELALHLSPGQNSPKALYRLAQFHQLNGDWITALAYFDLALYHSDLDDPELEFDRNVCQLEVLNQAEVEEFHWIPGEKNQTMAGLAVCRNPKKWSKVMDSKMNDPRQQLYAQVVKAHFLAQGLEVTQRNFDQVVKLYKGAVKGSLPSAFYNLGLLLQEGNGVQKDFFDAVRLFKMAAHFPINDKTEDWEKEGVLEAQYRLGLCFEFGLGVGKDNKKALHWFEMASLGDFAKASRKLGEIYSKGLLGVAKDEDMAIFCWEQAVYQGDTVAGKSTALHLLQSPPINWRKIQNSLSSFSKAILLNYREGNQSMIKDVLDWKQNFQTVLVSVLEEQTQPNLDENENEGNEDREPEEVSWNITAFVDHTLHTIHLLELVQTPEFQQKLETFPNWRKQFIYTDRLMRASNSCLQGLAALQELNKLYRNELIKVNVGQLNIETDYPPDLRSISGVDQATLVKEGQLVTFVLTSFANSIRLVRAAFVRDQVTQTLIHCLAQKVHTFTEPVLGVSTPQEIRNHFNATLLLFYILVLKGVEFEKMLEIFDPREGKVTLEPFLTISAGAVLGSLGQYGVIVHDLRKFLEKSEASYHPDLVSNSKCDLLFVQALCCKAAGLTRGVNSASRKKIQKSMNLFQQLLSICPKDDPRRAEAYYQLVLCTLYLEPMKVKGQSKDASLTAKDILDKVFPLFTQGEAAEQELPWKEFQLPQKSPVKSIVQQKIKELEALAENMLVQNLTSDLEGQSEKSGSLCFGRVIDPWFKFPVSVLPLKLREASHVEVIIKFRRFFKAARDKVGSSSSSILSSNQRRQFIELLSSPGSPFSGTDLFTKSKIVGCYEIVEPILHFRLADKEYPEMGKIQAFTVVQDESGAVFHLQFTMKCPGDGHHEIGQIEEYRIGARIIVHEPILRLDVDGGTSLKVNDATAQIFHLSASLADQHQEQDMSGEVRSTTKCGFCGNIGGNLQQCFKCQAVYYCGKECQMADWKELKHNWICPFLKGQSLLSSTLPIPEIELELELEPELIELKPVGLIGYYCSIL